MRICQPHFVQRGLMAVVSWRESVWILNQKPCFQIQAPALSRASQRTSQGPQLLQQELRDLMFSNTGGEMKWFEHGSKLNALPGKELGHVFRKMRLTHKMACDYQERTPKTTSHLWWKQSVQSFSKSAQDIVRKHKCSRPILSHILGISVEGRDLLF